MRKLAKILIPLLVLALLVGVFAVMAFASDIEQPTSSSTNPGITFTDATSKKLNSSIGSYETESGTVSYNLYHYAVPASGNASFGTDLKGVATTDGSAFTFNTRYSVWSLDLATASAMPTHFKIHGRGNSYASASASLATDWIENSGTFATEDVFPGINDTPFSWHNLTVVYDFTNNKWSCYADGVKFVSKQATGGIYNNLNFRFEPVNYATYTLGTSIAFSNVVAHNYAEENEMLAGLAAGEYTSFEDAGFENNNRVLTPAKAAAATEHTVNWYNPDGTVLLGTTKVQDGTIALDPIGLGGWATEIGGTALTDLTITEDTNLYTTTYMKITTVGSTKYGTDYWKDASGKNGTGTAVTAGNVFFYDKNCTDLYNEIHLGFTGNIKVDLFVDLETAGAFNWYNNQKLYLHGVTLKATAGQAMRTPGDGTAFYGVTYGEKRAAVNFTSNMMYFTSQCTVRLEDLDVTFGSNIDARQGNVIFVRCNVSLTGGRMLFSTGRSGNGAAKLVFVDSNFVATTNQAHAIATGQNGVNGAEVYFLGNTTITLADGKDLISSESCPDDAYDHVIVIGKDVKFNFSNSSTNYARVVAATVEDVKVYLEEGATVPHTDLSFWTAIENFKIATVDKENISYTATDKIVGWQYNGTFTKGSGSVDSFEISSYTACSAYVATKTVDGVMTNTYATNEDLNVLLLSNKIGSGVFDLYADYTYDMSAFKNKGIGYYWAPDSTFRLHGITFTQQCSQGWRYSMSSTFTFEGVGENSKYVVNGGQVLWCKTNNMNLTFKNLDVELKNGFFGTMDRGKLTFDNCSITMTNGSHFHTGDMITFNNTDIDYANNGTTVPVHINYSGATVKLLGDTSLTGKTHFITSISADHSSLLVIDNGLTCSINGNMLVNAKYANMVTAIAENTKVPNSSLTIWNSIDKFFFMTTDGTYAPTEEHGIFALGNDNLYTYVKEDDERIAYKIVTSEGAYLDASFVTSFNQEKVDAYQSSNAHFLLYKDVTLNMEDMAYLRSGSVTFELNQHTLNIAGDAEKRFTADKEAFVGLTFENGTVNHTNNKEIMISYYGALTFDNVVLKMLTSSVVDFRGGTLNFIGSELIVDTLPTEDYSAKIFNLAYNTNVETVVNITDSEIVVPNGNIVSIATTKDKLQKITINVTDSTLDAGTGTPITAGSAEGTLEGTFVDISIDNTFYKSGSTRLVHGGSGSYPTTITLGAGTYINRTTVGTGHTLKVADGYMLADSDLEGYTHMVTEKVEIKVKSNLTLYNTIQYNVYLPFNVVSVNGIDTAGLDKVDTDYDGEDDCYMFSVANLAPTEAATKIEVKLVFTQGDKTYYYDFTTSVLDYLSKAINSVYNNSRVLTASVARYIETSYNYLGKDIAELSAILDNETYKTVAATLPSLETAVTGEKLNAGTIDDAFDTVNLILGEVIKVRYNIKSGYKGTVVINGTEFVIADGLYNGETYVEVDVRAFEFYRYGVKVTGDVAGAQNIHNYIEALGNTYTGSDKTLVNALYYYCKAASEYKANPQS